MAPSLKQTVKGVARRLLPGPVKSLLFNGAFSVMSEGERDRLMVNYQMASVERSLRRARALGFRPRHIVDVGAYVGNWTRMAKSIFPEASVLMVEAQRAREEDLRRACAEFGGEVGYAVSLLGAEERESVPFYELEAGADTGSSVLHAHSRVGSREVGYPMETLDRVLAAAGWDGADFLKLDVQGYELEVLKGARRTLGGAEAVLMEVSLLGVYEGAPLLHDVVRFMDERGFRVYDICSFIRRPLDEALWQTDFLFVRHDSPLVASKEFH